MNHARYVLINRLAMPLGGFLLLIVIGRHSDALLGEYALVMSCYFIMQMLPLLGLTPYLMREVARAPERAGTYFSTVGFLSLVACIAVDGLAFVLVRAAGYSEDVLAALLVMGVLVFPGIILFIAEVLFISARRARPIAWVALAENVVRVLGSMAALWLGGGLVALVVVFLATRAGALAAYLVCLRRMRIVERLERPDPQLLREIVHLLPSFFTGTVLFAVFSRLDFVALSIYEPVEQIGYYAIGYRLFEIGIMVLSALVMSAFPWAARVYSRTRGRFPSAARTLLVSMTLGIAFAAFCGVVLGEGYVRLLFANQFPRAVLLTQLFLAALVIAGVDYVLGALLHASDGQRDDTRSMMLGGAAQIGLLVALIPPYGMYGAFIAKAVGHTVQAIVRFTLLQRRVGTLVSPGLAVRLLALVLLLAAAALTLMDASWAVRFTGIALMGLVVFPLAAIGLGVLQPLRLLRYYFRRTRRGTPEASKIRTIGCLMLNSVGDILCTTPALAALKERYPEARITMLVRPHMAALVADHPAVDDLVFFGSGSLRERIAFVREARRRRFDLWVDLHTPTFNTVSSNTRNFIRNALLMVAAAPRFRRAYAVPQLRPFLTHPLRVPSEEALRGMNVVDLTVALGWPTAGRRYSKHLAVSPADRQWAAESLPAGGARRIGLFFGTRQPANAWPPQHQRSLVEALLRRLPDVEAVLVGDNTDRDGARAILESLDAPLRDRVHDFTGRTSLAQTGALLSRCAAIVATNSGGMHIADASDIPIVALFSMHNHPGVWNPVNGKSIVLHHEIACGPCFRSVCPVGNACMASITPEEALEALLAVLPSQREM